MSLYWHNTQTIASKDFTCGHCGHSISSNIGYTKHIQESGSGATNGHLYVCHKCFKPTFIEGGIQVPGERPGEDVSGIDNAGVEALYKEARDAYSNNAFTACVLTCRKLLMHIAVTKGAKENESFISYVEYLSDNHYVPPDAKDWVDHIRKKGNEANHDIVIMTKEEADDLLAFIAMLLKLIYEFPGKMKKDTTAD